MSKRISLTLFLSLLINLSFGEVVAAKNEEKPYTTKDATKAIDAFNATYYDGTKGIFYYNSTHTNNPWINTNYSQIWTQPIYWDMIMNAYKRTNDPKYLKQVKDIFQGAYKSYDAFNWNNHKVWFIYDDMMWWIGSLARGYQVTGDQAYLDHSIAGFKHVYDESFDPSDGGMYWDFDHTGKMSCINYPTIIAAMTLYNITKDQSYLDKAKALYVYSRKSFFDHGKVADSKHGVGVDWTTHVYNQATCIGSAVMLYKQTGEKSYLDDAVQAADYTKEHMTYANGILNYETGVEQGIYTAIFSQYIAMLINDGKQTQYLDWMRYNIDSAWKNRRVEGDLTFLDAVKKCPEGAIQAYDGSACPALMQVIAPIKK